MVLAKRSQDLEQGLWGERIKAAEAAKEVANTAASDAGDAVTAVKEQVSTRSWLYETLGVIDVTSYASGCNATNKPCDLTELARPDTSSSTWGFATNCDYVTGSGLSEVTHSCTVLGLSGSSAGLVQSAQAMKGAARNGATAPTELEAAYETADYAFVSSSTQLNSNDSSKLEIALDGYLEW